MLISKLFNPLKTWSHGIVKHNQEFDWVYVTILWDQVLKVYVLFVMFCMDVLYVYCMHIYIYVCIYVYVYLYVCIYVYILYICVFVSVHISVCSSVYIYACLYICVGTHFCLYKSYLFNCFSCRCLGCYLLVWHCYLGSILAFSFEFLNSNTTICTKSST